MKSDDFGENCFYIFYLQFDAILRSNFRFIRSGKINSFEQDMSEDFVSRFDEYEKTITEGSDFKFDF